MKSSMVKKKKSRLNLLTQLAYKYDPRIIMEEEKIKLQREKEKQAFLEQKQKEKLEAEQKLIEYKRQQEENQKKMQEDLARQKEELIKNIINLGESLSLSLTKDDIFNIQLNAKLDNMRNLISEDQKFTTTEEELKNYKSLTSQYFGIKYQDNKTLEESMQWKKEEVIALQKASKKFPGGTRNRWDRISEIVSTKPQNQIIQMCHYLTTNPSIRIDGDIDLYQILYKSKKQENAKKKEEEKPVAKANNDEDTWTDEQQKSLETALKKYPASLSANERWTSISKDVEGKNKKQCVERFKYLS